MRCHYEVLGVDRNADEKQLKLAYRSLARKNHPDKHPDEQELYTKIFKELQGAYDILSDKHERKWYDDHRDVILAGGTGNESTGTGLDLYPYFSSTCYTGFDDGEEGFYTVYRNVFETIAREDFEASGDMDLYYPTFGLSNADYRSTVKEFYAFWDNYFSTKTFGYADDINPMDAPNRYVRRLVEKENKKLRDAERKKYNERVRELVMFINKRDKRVQQYKAKDEADRRRREKEAKAQAEEIAREKKQRRQMERQEALQQYEEQEWNRTDVNQLDNVLAEWDSDVSVESASETSDGFELDEEDETTSDAERLVDAEFELACVACVKIFNTKKALRHHNTTKKHMRKVEALRQELELDDDLLSDSDTYTEANGSASVSGAASPFPIVDDAHTLPLADETNDGPAQCGDVNTQPSDLNTNHVSDDDRIGEPESGGALADKEASGCEGKALAYATPAKGKKKKKKNINRHGGETVDDVALQAALDALDVRNNESDDEKPQKKKKGRRAAKGAKATTENICGSTTESSNTERGTKSKAKAKVSAEVNACSVCDAEFDTRNEVFRHLETAHEMRKGGKQKGKRR